jgi:hypothetical protein
MAHFLLNLVKAKRGQQWRSTSCKHIHTYSPVVSQHLGVPKYMRGKLVGDKVGLDAFFLEEEALISKCKLLWRRSLDIREENLLQMVLWKTVHFALFLVKISINFSTGYSTVFFSSQCTSLLYNNFKILLQKFQNFCTMF